MLKDALPTGTDIALVSAAVTVIATGGLALPVAGLVAGLTAWVVGWRSAERIWGKK